MNKKNIKYYLFTLICFFHYSAKSQKFTARNFENKSIKRVLVIRQDNRIGNLLFITPLLELIYRQYHCKADVIVGNKSAQVLKNHPYVNKIIPYQYKFPTNLINFNRWIHHLNKQKYDLIIDCKECFSFNNALLSLFIKAKYKIGFAKPCSEYYMNFSIEGKDNVMMHESVYLSQPFIKFCNIVNKVPKMKYHLQNIYQIDAIKSKQKLVVIHIGGRNKKSISMEFINELIMQLNKNKIEPVIVFGPDENEKINLLNGQLDFIKYSPSNIDELAFIINKSDVFITPDTGPLHIASALNKSIVAIFNQIKNQHRYSTRSSSECLEIFLDVCGDKDAVIQCVEFCQSQQQGNFNMQNKAS